MMISLLQVMQLLQVCKAVQAATHTQNISQILNQTLAVLYY
jgi:hypothetical protein